MKKNLNAWKRTISSVAALAIVLSLGMPFTTAFADETGTPSEFSSAPVESAAPESSSASSEAQSAEKWEDTAAAAIGSVSGRDGVEKVYNYLQGLEGHKDAQSFQTLAGKCGLTSKVVTGTLSGAAHSWNVVQLDGTWYAVDVAKGVLLAGAKTVLADGKTVFGDVYKTTDTTALSEENNKIVVTIRPTVNQKKIYGDADPSFSYTASIKIDLDGTLSRAPGEDVGEYAYTLGTVKVKDAANAGKYKLELAKDASKFKIEKKTLAVGGVELESETKVANETPSVPVRKVILEGNIPESEVSVNMAGVIAAVSSNEAGVYSNITLSGLALQGTKAGNYMIAESAVVNKSFTIKAPEAPVVVNDGVEGTNGEPVGNQSGNMISDSPLDGNEDNTSDNSSNTMPSESSSQQNTSSSDSSLSSTSSEESSSSSTESSSAPSESSSSSSESSSENNSGSSSNSGNTSGGNDSEDSKKDENVTGPSEGETTTPAEKTVVKIKFENQTKIYGEKDPEIGDKYTLIGLPEGETLTVTGTPKREVKEDSENVGFHPYTTVEGLTLSSDKYKPELAEDSGGLTIIQRPVAVSFRSSAFEVDLNEKEKTAFVEYDGKSKALEGYYQAVRGDACKVKVLYNGLETVPTEKGTYSLSVVVEDPNYSLTSEPLAIDKMVITEKLFTPVDQNRTIAKNDTSEKSIPLSSFGIPSEWYDKVQITNLEGDLVVEDYDSKLLYIKDGRLFYRLKSGVTAGQQGKIVLWIPEINIYARLTVMVGEQGFEVSVQNPPSNVTLGNDISVSSSSFRLVFKYDNGETKYESITRDMLSGYDKTATGTNSIGNKVITVTSKTREPGATATFKIRVNDRIIGLEVGEPDQTYYYTSDSRLDLTGGWVALKMQSGIPQDSVKLGFSMINRTHSILNKAGSYPVRVEYKGYTMSDAFTFIVERDSYVGFDNMYPAVSTTSTPDSGDFGVALSTSDLKGSHNRNDVYLVVEDRWDDELDDYMYQRSFDDYELMEMFLRDDSTGEELEIRSGREVTVYIPYPQGTSSSRHTFTVYHLVNGRVRTEKVTALSNHLKVSVSSFSPFAVAWKQKSSISGGNSSGGSNLSAAVQHQQEMQEFWNDVTDTLKDTKSGRSVLVDAGDYDYVPSKVLKAIKDRDVTLKIENDTTKTIVLNGKKPPITGSLKTSYTMSELYDAVKGTTSSSSGGSNIINNNNTSASSLESLWSGVVKSLKSYQEGTSITVNAKDNSNIPKTVLDAVRGRNVTVKLKSESHPTITFNGKEMPVDLPSQRQYTLQELYDATVPESVSDMEELWSGVTDDLKSYKAGAKVTISAGNNTFIPNTVLDAIRGRNVTIKIKSDYTSDLITLNGASLPKSLSGEKYYSISQLANRAKTGGTIIYPSGGNTQQNNVQSSAQSTGKSSAVTGGGTGTTSQVVSSQGTAGSSQSSSSQSSAVAAVSGSIGSSSSQSSSKITAPSDTIIPPINGEGDTVPSIEETKKGDSILPKVIIGVMIFAILIVAGILIFLLSGTRSRPR